MGDSFTRREARATTASEGATEASNKRGEKLYGWTEQENLGGEQTLRGGVPLLPTLIVEHGSDYTTRAARGTPATCPAELPGGFERYLAPGGPNAAYYPQAQFVSSRGYGFLLNQNAFSRWRMANDRRAAWQVQASGAQARLHGHPRPRPARARCAR